MNLTHENYYSRKADSYYVSASQYKSFIGTFGRTGCEAAALAKLKGEYEEPATTALLVGSYVDAFFSGTLEQFTMEHPEIISTKGATKGQLKSEYKQAEAMIERALRDELFMKYLSGDKQVIMTGSIEGVPVKIMIDSFGGSWITDLKTVESISKTFWVADSDQKMNFVEYWGYDLQLAIYREIVRQNTGDTCPCFIAAISKNKTGSVPHPRIKVIEIPPMVMDEKLIEVKRNITKIQDLKQEVYEPVRCELCDYCADTEILDGPISMDEIMGDL